MRGSIVVLALIVTPLAARVSQAQHRPHWVRHDLPARHHDDDKKCEDRTRGNPSQNGLDHRADPRTKGNKDCSVGSNSGGSTGGTTGGTTSGTPDTASTQLGTTGIQGSLFFDVDQDGFFGPDEVGLAGWTVQVFGGPTTASAVTDGNGAYSITGLAAGTYTVCVMAPAGWTQTAPSAGTGPACVNATVGISIDAPAVVGDVLYSGVDFGFISN